MELFIDHRIIIMDLHHIIHDIISLVHEFDFVG